MSLFLPGMMPIQTPCSLCDLPAVYMAIIKVKISDASTSKVVATAIDLRVCERHADRMDIQMDKVLHVEKKVILLGP